MGFISEYGYGVGVIFGFFFCVCVFNLCLLVALSCNVLEEGSFWNGWYKILGIFFFSFVLILLIFFSIDVCVWWVLLLIPFIIGHVPEGFIRWFFGAGDVGMIVLFGGREVVCLPEGSWKAQGERWMRTVEERNVVAQMDVYEGRSVAVWWVAWSVEEERKRHRWTSEWEQDVKVRLAATRARERGGSWLSWASERKEKRREKNEDIFLIFDTMKWIRLKLFLVIGVSEFEVIVRLKLGGCVRDTFPFLLANGS